MIYSAAMRLENRAGATGHIAADPVGSSPEAFGACMRAETEKWAKLVKATGARVD